MLLLISALTDCLEIACWHGGSKSYTVYVETQSLYWLEGLNDECLEIGRQYIRHARSMFANSTLPLYSTAGSMSTLS